MTRRILLMTATSLFSLASVAQAPKVQCSLTIVDDEAATRDHGSPVTVSVEKASRQENGFEMSAFLKPIHMTYTQIPAANYELHISIGYGTHSTSFFTQVDAKQRTYSISHTHDHETAHVNCVQNIN